MALADVMPIVTGLQSAQLDSPHSWTVCTVWICLGCFSSAHSPPYLGTGPLLLEQTVQTKSGFLHKYRKVILTLISPGHLFIKH